MSKKQLLPACKNCKCQRYTPCKCMKPAGYKEEKSSEEKGE